MVIRIDHKLRIALSELPHDVRDSIVEALSLPNLERQKAMEQNTPGWEHMPEKIQLWDVEKAALVMPRGFIGPLLQGLEAYGIKTNIDMHTTFLRPYEEKGMKISLRPWQQRFVDFARPGLLAGIYKAPAGSGKTVAVLELIRLIHQRAIILVNTKDILYQWIARARQFLGPDYPVGIIGDGQFATTKHLNIATVQTLNNRYEELENLGFFDSFGFMCLDECHHATASTYNRLVDRFSSTWRIGVSATPDKTGDFALAQAVLGPIVYETRREEVHNIIKPIIYRIPTTFRYPFRPASGRRPSNYGKMIQALTNDEERNWLIAKSILIEEGTHTLVLSKRLEHLDNIQALLEENEYQYPIHRITGKESSEERNRVVEYANSEPCCILSTLADEALDIRRLDRLFLAFPQRNPGLIEQQVGRVSRFHHDKDEARVFDFHDIDCEPLNAQWHVRRNRVYAAHGYEIFDVNRRDILNYVGE
jgi:superfamily II DNA or RNA helicase